MSENHERRIEQRKKIVYTKESPKGRPVSCGCCGHWLYFKKNNEMYIQCRKCGRQTVISLRDD